MATYEEHQAYREHGVLRIANVGRYAAQAVGPNGTRDCGMVTGPDVNGRLCVIGRYSSHADAVRACLTMGLEHGPVRGMWFTGSGPRLGVGT